MSQRPLHVVVLAAGQGKRMRSPSPKVLATVAAKPLLNHVVQAASELGPSRIHVVVGHGAEEVRAALPDLEVNFVLQAEQLGTGHAAMQALVHVDDDAQVLVLLGDAPLMRPDTLRGLLNFKGEVALLSAMVEDPRGYGRIVRGSEGVERIVEHRDASADELRIREVNSGVLCAPADLLRAWLVRLDANNTQGEYYLTDIVAMAREDGIGVHAVIAEEATEILGANDRWQLSQLERLYQQREARRLCLEGAQIMDPARFDVRGKVTLGGPVLIDVGVVLEGDVYLDAGCVIGPHCVIKNARLGPGTRVHAMSVVDGVETAGECDIGPFARLRPGTRLAKATRIGNFVETKKAQLGEGSKANHLTYLGDTEVGRNVNIGAGTITCNYDGVNKHRTVIEDRAFIGSGTQLVAPVTVGEGATIGAGSTITRAAPAEKLTLTRARTRTVEDWRRPAKKED